MTHGVHPDQLPVVYIISTQATCQAIFTSKQSDKRPNDLQSWDHMFRPLAYHGFTLDPRLMGHRTDHNTGHPLAVNMTTAIL